MIAIATVETRRKHDFGRESVWLHVEQTTLLKFVLRAERDPACAWLAIIVIPCKLRLTNVCKKALQWGSASDSDTKQLRRFRFPESSTPITNSTVQSTPLPP